jgi:ATP-dependent exoDNAse (exonuclease V) beta subunit
MTKKSKTTNTIIRASAGSGKTFLLSNTFLNILFQSDSPVDATLNTILASTFTRKAAGEITDRIFTKFADVALEPNKRKELGDYLCYPKSKDLDNTLQTLLAELARNMYRLRIGTLDAYFNKIATAFSLELGLPPGWTMLDDTEFPRLLTEAVREVFNESKRNDAKRLMHLLQKEEESASMMKELVGLAKIMLPLVRETNRNNWNHATPDRLENHIHDFLSEEKIDEFLERIEAITDDRLPQTAKKTPVKDYIAARDDIKGAIHSRDWKAFIETTLVQKVALFLDDPQLECKYSRKDVRGEAPVLFEIVRTLLPHAKSVQIKILVGQTQATYELLKMVAEKLDSIMERERKFRFEDITRKIADFGFKNRLDSLQHRLNAETKHLLLDEFQDTSLPQWEILEPLALQTASDKDGTYFCVGDEKQSIYSWRGGEAAIFGSMKSRMEQGQHGLKIDENTMEQTRRCAKPIVDTVNTLFEKIHESPTVKKASEKAGSRWQQRFKHHSTANEKPGYCALEESPLAEDKDKDTPHIRYVVERIKQLIPIVQHRSDLKEGIGILVATKKFGAKIVSALKEEGIETTGSGGTLSQSPAVQCIISALVFAEHPGNTIARFHLAHSPLAETIGFNDHDDS